MLWCVLLYSFSSMCGIGYLLWFDWCYCYCGLCVVCCSCVMIWMIRVAFCCIYVVIRGSCCSCVMCQSSWLLLCYCICCMMLFFLLYVAYPCTFYHMHCTLYVLLILHIYCIFVVLGISCVFLCSREQNISSLCSCYLAYTTHCSVCCLLSPPMFCNYRVLFYVFL